MKLKFNVVINQLGENYVAVPVGEKAEELGGFLKLNETGAFIIGELNNDISYDELVNKCVEKYACDADEAKKSIDNIIDGLQKANILMQ